MSFPGRVVNAPLLQVEELQVAFEVGGRWARRRFKALDEVQLHVAAGETVGLVGESGSGKSTLARAILRLIAVQAGRVVLNGVDWLDLNRRQLRDARRNMQMVFQDPLSSLNPRMTVRDTLLEPLSIFNTGGDAARREATVQAMLHQVGLPADAADRYPHQFSGGQCQRIGIARAMMLAPQLLVCDEPVSSLDVSIQGQIINLLMDMQGAAGMAMIFISHNLAVVRHISQRVYVMYRGRIVETAACESLFARPAHPYTRALIDSIPQIGARPPPPAVALALESVDIEGCAFRARCPLAMPRCASQRPQLRPLAAEHWVACHAALG